MGFRRKMEEHGSRLDGVRSLRFLRSSTTPTKLFGIVFVCGTASEYPGPTIPVDEFGGWDDLDITEARQAGLERWADFCAPVTFDSSDDHIELNPTTHPVFPLKLRKV